MVEYFYMHDLELTHLLSEAFGKTAEILNVEILPRGNSGLFKARITGSANRRRFSAVVKARQDTADHAALWYAKDSRIVDREFRVYELLEHLRVPHARILARCYDSPTKWALLMEDLREGYVMLADDYRFSTVEQEIIAKTYATIHNASRSAPQLMVAAEDFLAPEEGSQVHAGSIEKMWEVLREAQIGGHRLSRQDFLNSCSVLFEGRERWKGESRVLVYNDFHPSNVALPKLEQEYAVLFDWELAGIGFPQFDLQNFWTDRDVDRGRILSVYLDHSKGIDFDRFMSVMPYAELCRQFYTLWLLYLKLEADPGGKLPSWLRLHSERLFSGELARLAGEVLL